MERKNRQHTAEFKQGAVELARQLNSVAEAAKQLGINENSIYAWRLKPEFSGTATTKPAVVKSAEQQEIERLRKENGELKKVNQILKHAAAFFSQDHLK
jgi:transposase-like protein